MWDWEKNTREADVLIAAGTEQADRLLAFMQATMTKAAEPAGKPN